MEIIGNKNFNIVEWINRKIPDKAWAKYQKEMRREKEEVLFRIPGFKKKDFDAPIYVSGERKKRNGFIRCGYSSGGMADHTSSKKRQVYFHCTYSKNLAVHKRHLSWYMPQNDKELEKDKAASNIFGTDPEVYMENMTGLHHKIVISPECPDGDFEAAAKSFINHVEMLTGYDLLWRGVVHNDTAHRHIHLCINGIDKNGKKVIFDPTNVKNGFRETCSYIFTQLQGERNDREIEAARSNAPVRNRWTYLDERIIEAASNKDISPADNLDPMIRRRLDYLIEIGLCNCDGIKFSFDPNWKEVLVNTGRYNTYMSEYLEPNKLPLRLYKGGYIEGTVEKVITFDREEAFNNAVIINDGTARYYVAAYDFKGNPASLLNSVVSVNAVSKSNRQFINVKPDEIKVIEAEKKKRRRNVATNSGAITHEDERHNNQ